MKDLLASGAAIEILFEEPGIAEVIRAHAATAAARSGARAVAEVARGLVLTRYGSVRIASDYAALYRRVLEGQA